MLPRGVFASAGGTSPDVVNHVQTKGVLVRVPWSSIEPAAGGFDFRSIDTQVALAKAAGKGWSLAVVAGPTAPTWLYAAPYDVPPMSITFRSQPVRVPQFWNATLQQRVTALAQSLASRYGSDDSLRLVYLPQMSSNGIEGHFNGNTSSALAAQGLTENRWVEAVLQASRSFAAAFPTKPVAVELHYILDSAGAATRIMRAIESDSALLNQVGVALWWISGKNDYQPELLTAFASFRGAVYAQLIDRADNVASFHNGDYSTAFSQAKALRVRYIEPWEVDLISRRWDTLFDDFNRYATQ